MNVALYGRPRKWTMTERGRGALARDASQITIGPSAMRWDGTALRITIDETSVPIPSRVRGEIVVKPRGMSDETFVLDAAGRHRWRPIAPLCDVEARFQAPDLAWTGTGYWDTNDGDEPLEAAFRHWTWSRFDLGDHARVFYDRTLRDGSERRLSLAIRGAAIAPAPTIGTRPLPTSGWRMARAAPCEDGHAPVMLRSLEDAPFYTRAAIRSTIDGHSVVGVHETLSLSRLITPVVRMMLPFRMPRRA